MEQLTTIVEQLNGIMSNNVLIVALLGGGIIFSVALGFIQVRGFGKAMKLMFGGLFSKKSEAGADGMSSFQALATAIAAQVGTGNIAGAATAIAVGGAGAIFWMWVAAFLGMSTIFAEAVLAQKFKVRGDDGEITGGPVYYIREAFKGRVGKTLAAIFAVLITLALAFMGNAVQSNSIAAAFNTAFNIQPWIIGLIVAVISFVIFFGGIKRIAQITETIVPVMALLYIIGGLIVVFAHIGELPRVIVDIFRGAFAPASIYGGASGIVIKQAITLGVKRGLFSNEAGMGSTPHAHAVAKVNHPAEQGFVAMAGVFVDTFIVLNITAFVILTSVSREFLAQNAADIAAKVDGALQGTSLTQYAFTTVLKGNIGNIFIAVCMFFFAFSTVIGWYFFGQANIKYLFGSKAVRVYSIVVCVCVFLGSLAKVGLVWEMSDLFNSLMVIPNIVALLALIGVARAIMKDYYDKEK